MLARYFQHPGLMMAHMPTALQIGASIVRVFAFGWAVFQIEQLPEHSLLLQFVGVLPFWAIFDVLCQSWSRSALIKREAWTGHVHRWRIAFALISMTILAATLRLLSFLPDFQAAVLLISCCSLLGSLAFVWERWLAVPGRAAIAAMVEILVLAFAVLAYSQNWLGQAVLILCFVAYLLARILVLLVPGRAARHDFVPQVKGGTRQYLGFALGQQVLGATAASMPALYAALTGSTAGLAVALAAFRAMHSFAAMASFVINAIGGRLFHGEAARESEIIELVAARLKRVRPLIDGICLILIIAVTTFRPSDVFLVLPAFVIMLAALNFRSSCAINRGRPRECFMLQGSVFLASVMAIFCVYTHTAFTWSAAIAYVIFGVLTDGHHFRSAAASAGGGRSLS